MKEVADEARNKEEVQKQLVNIIRAVSCDNHQFDILTSVDTDKALQPSFKLRHSK